MTATPDRMGRFVPLWPPPCPSENLKGSISRKFAVREFPPRLQPLDRFQAQPSIGVWRVRLSQFQSSLGRRRKLLPDDLDWSTSLPVTTYSSDCPRGESSETERVRSRGLGADGVSLIPFLGSATVCRLTDVLSWHGPAPNARTHFSVPASPNSRRGAAQGLKRTLVPRAVVSEVPDGDGTADAGSRSALASGLLRWLAHEVPAAFGPGFRTKRRPTGSRWSTHGPGAEGPFREKTAGPVSPCRGCPRRCGRFPLAFCAGPGPPRCTTRSRRLPPDHLVEHAGARCPHVAPIASTAN